jgi:hypothetical protein
MHLMGDATDMARLVSDAQAIFVSGRTGRAARPDTGRRRLEMQQPPAGPLEGGAHSSGAA